MNKILGVLLLSVALALPFLPPAQAACPAGSPAGINCENYQGQVLDSVTGGTAQRKDQDRFNDHGVSAPDIGVDCTGVSDSTSAIQTWASANLSGHLIIPVGCTVSTSSQITITNGVGFEITADNTAGDGGVPPTWIWNGTNGGTACYDSGTASCVYVLSFVSSDHPSVRGINFTANTTSTGWIGDACPDGFLLFDGHTGSSIGTAGHIERNTFNMGGCNNPNTVAVNISPVTTQNQEDYYLFDNTIVCSAHAAAVYSKVGVSGGTTALSAANAPFSAGDVGRRIRVLNGTHDFETTIATYVDASDITVTASVPYSATAEVFVVGGGEGVGIRNGASQNALQQVVDKVDYSLCEIGVQVQGGNMTINQATGGNSDIGEFIGGFTAQQTYVDYPAAESNLVDQFFAAGSVAPASLNHARWSNSKQLPTGFVVGPQLVTNGLIDFTPPTANSVFYNGAYTYSVTNIGTPAGGSSYTTGTYTGVPLLVSQGAVGGPGPTSGVGADIGIKGTVVVSGGAVTSVTVTTAGSFLAFPFPINGHITLYSLTAAVANIGGTGSGFTVPITGLAANLPSSGVGIISMNNNYNDVINWAQLNIGPGNAAQATSIGDNFGGFSGLPALYYYSCGLGNQVLDCNQTIFYTNGGGDATFDAVLHDFTSPSGTSINYKSEGDSSPAEFVGFYSLPSTGEASTYQAGFESAPNVNGVSAPGGSSQYYAFLADAMSINGGNNLTNSYGLYIAQQTVTHVGQGWGVFQSSIADWNSFAGPVITQPTVVGSLPSCTSSLQGARMFVTDQATAVAYHGAVSGSGSFKQGVTCDGSSWYQD